MTNESPPSDDPLNLFLPPVGAWFREALGTPTPAQRQGWPSIAAGRSTLILAPTGSGKTLAAFLACLDRLWRQPRPEPGVRILYVSPLKALNNDIYRNLRRPLDGVAAAAETLGQPLPVIETAVRTGDTTTAERQRQVRRPPHVLITTPESLHLLLTSRARETLRTVSHVIVDEIHALCATKRGVFLALLLERLAAIVPAGFVRIGLSATQRPLDEVARFLGGQEVGDDGTLSPRPVTLVDAGIRKDLDLKVISPVEFGGRLAERSVWPSIYRLLAGLIAEHRSTIIFANDRRKVEQITAHLNAAVAEDFSETGGVPPAPRLPLLPLQTPEKELARAHHGSVALDVRQQTEEALKEGRLPAVVATASLEMGIDMGAVDLVCQVESPGNVARGLQRVGRAGHVVGQKSKGRLIAKTAGDVLEQAVLAREMAAGRVEAVRVPTNCLDVLAQQVVAMVGQDEWEIPRLYAVLRQAYPYRDLTPQALDVVLELLSGRYRAGGEKASAQSLAALQPRVSWDRVHNRLLPLPGTRQVALVNGGTIPDTGSYAAYTTGGVRIGELDEEFIFERRVGDAFLLGTNAWRIEQIEADRVIVAPAEGAPAVLPFWRGEGVGRSYDLGLAIGGFLRDYQPRLGTPASRDWLRDEYFLDDTSAQVLEHHVRRQLMLTGCLPTDRTLVVEASRDQLGDWQVILLSPLGSRLHLGMRLALEAVLRQRLGYRPQCLHHDNGLLIRLTDSEEPVLDPFEGVTPENVESLLIPELIDSALFALRFRQNAARALLLPRTTPGKRAPLWLQRLRGRDLLQVARRYADFPLVAETVRECLHDHLDVPRLRHLLADIRSGDVRLVTRRADAPSPFASELLFAFTAANLYVTDRTDPAGDAKPPTGLDPQLLDQLLSPDRHAFRLDPRAVGQVERRLRGGGLPPRTATEAAEWLRRLGDLAGSELEGPMAGFLEELERDGRACRVVLPRVREPERWVLTEDAALYRRAFGLTSEAAAAADISAAGRTILDRFLATHALVGLADVLSRYPFEREWATRQLADWVGAGRVVTVPNDGPDVQWSLPENLEQMQRGTLAVRRSEVVACPPTRFAEFLLHWQYAHPAARRTGPAALGEVLDRLEGLALPAELWEHTVLPARVAGYQPRRLDDWVSGGDGVWVGDGSQAGSQTGPGALAFFRRDTVLELPCADADRPLDAIAGNVMESLWRRGASFVADVAADTRLPPNTVRAALWALVRARVVTNDRFDVVRAGESAVTPAADQVPARRPSLRSLRRQLTRPEGRWSLVPWGHADAEHLALRRAGLLLGRYGIVCRELALQDDGMPPWRVLYEVLSRLEMSGEVRRGYFVEGLSGAQFALPEAVRMLQDLDLPSTAAAPVVLLHSLDPANVYGSGAPLDVSLLDGGTRPLARRAGTWLTLKAGRPVLLVEQQGKKLTALPSASRADVIESVKRLPDILLADRGLGGRRQLSVDQWNGQPVTAGEGVELLEAAGFVRDYQSMTLYAGWR